MRIIITDIHPESRTHEYFNDFVGKTGKFEIIGRCEYDESFTEGDLYFDIPFKSGIMSKKITYWGFCGIKYKVIE